MGPLSRRDYKKKLITLTLTVITIITYLVKVFPLLIFKTSLFLEGEKSGQTPYLCPPFADRSEVLLMDASQLLFFCFFPTFPVESSLL